MLMDELEEFRRLILDKGVKFNEGISRNENEYGWMIDTREVILNSRGSYLASKLLYEKFLEFNCNNVGGLTLAADPLVSYIVLLGSQNNKNINGFIIRKEPNKFGLQKLVEGDFNHGQEVVIIDDLINSGENIKKAIEVVEMNGGIVKGILALINYENLKVNLDKYPIKYLFTLGDFYIKNKIENGKEESTVKLWSKDGINNWDSFVPRSSPVHHEGLVYFGTNEGKFFCLDSENGKERWSFNLNINNPKGILSSPVIQDNKVFFGAYDGIFYCLDANDGKLIWKNKLGNWVGSSPVVFGDNLFVGVEYGAKQGALACLDVKDGELKWHLKTNHFIHSSPAAIKEVVVVGCNDGCVYAAGVDDGKLLWKYDIGKEIKAGFAVDEDLGYVYFGAFDGCIYCITIDKGEVVWKRRVSDIVYSTPEIVGDYLVCSVASSRVFVLNKKNGEIEWFYNTKEMIFSSTKTVDNKVFCGCNDCFLYVLDLRNKELISKYYVGKKILTKPLVVGENIYLGCKGGFVCINN